MLHTLSHSPYHCDIDALLRCLGPDDAVVLLQDGVIAALADTDVAKRFLNAAVPLYALKNDADARGLTERISGNVSLIDYNQFVQLTVKYPKQLAW
ncbi:sulfurtransferase complex subunit TusB [Brenneria izadpanahii]|uniref:Protein TusB n=1 Tax=Brenneria izadpanahii TaxID=2722756 RepID=A0ABX7UT67_9GAMM|nr:sulfurtransferase complex subunit TusB [Brenneria izadpanahii]QTF06874.1 sulfurtransferase complex subunit TusB [Brenneria izadpanahii]